MPPLTIVGGQLVDVAGGRLTEPRTIIIEDGRIEAVEPAGPLIGDAIDAHGRFVAPGLIDAHVHLVFDGGPDPVGSYRAATRDELREVALRNAGTALQAGITTVRDLGAPLEVIAAVAEAIAAGQAWGPDIVHAGAAITRIRGHIGLFGGEVADPEEARRLVARQLDAGMRAVKIVVSGGGLTPGTRPDRVELPAAVIRAAAEVGRSHAVPVAAHCHASAAIRLAVAAGATTIEHASFLAANGRVAFDRDLAIRLRDRGVAVVPTASGALRTAARYRVATAANPVDRHAIDRLEARRWLTGELHALRVPIVAGTDAGVIETPFDSLHDELAIYGAVGLSPADALRSATVLAAERLGLGDRGTIEIGRRADLLILDHDPLRDLAALRRPHAIVAAGRLIPAR